MVSYYLLWISFIFFTLLSKFKKLNAVSVFSIFLLVFLFVGLRPVSLGTDTLSYFEIYESWNYGVFDSGLEYIFSFLVTSFKYFNLDFSYFLAFLTSIFLAGIFVFWKGFFKGDAVFLLLVFSTLNFWLFSLNIIRNGIAFSFLLIGIYFFIKKGRGSLGLYLSLLLAIGFHISIIFAIVALMLFSKRVISNNINKIPILLAFSQLLVFLGIDLLQIFHTLIVMFQGYLPDRLVSRFFLYLSLDGSNPLRIGYTYYLNLVVLLFSLFFEKKYRNRSSAEDHYLYLLSIFFVAIFVLLYPMIYKYSAFSRVLSNFEFFHIILLFKMIKLNIKSRHAFILLLMISSLFFLKVVISGFSYNFLMDRF